MIRGPLSRYPGMNRFVLDWLASDPKATRFLPRLGVLRPSRSSKSGGLAAALLQSNKHWGLFTREPLERWQRGETVTIVAGQQVGFAGGPLYTLAKLATLIRMKRDLEKQGTPVTAFFWMATEDHDFDEVSQLNVPVSTLGPGKNVNRQLDLLCMRAVRGADARAAVGSLPVPESLITQLLALYDISRPDWLRPGITFGDSFAELIAAAAGSDVILVDALLPELRRAGASLFGQIHARRNEIQNALAQRGEELKAAGYNEQVIARDGDEYTLFFELVDGHRQPFTRPVDPERISTSALTRPLLQDFVLRPDIFIGGPAEVAYYAQLSTLHDLLGVTMPRVALRGHALVAPKRVVRFFERFDIDPTDVFTSPDALLADAEPEGVARIRALKDEAKRDLLARIEQIGELALPADHSLAGSIQRSIGHLEYHFEKLAERAVKGLVRKDRERHTAARELVATLFPDRHVQDRVVSWFAYWCVYGSHLVERVVEEIEPDSDHFRIIDL
jgi:bacillithiol synthase